MRRTRNGYTMKQWAYAHGKIGGKEKTKKALALAAGFSPSVAASVTHHVEKTEGFHNAMSELAGTAGNVALSVMHKLQTSHIDKMSADQLLRAVTVLSDAFEKFQPKIKNEPVDGNTLRTIFLQNVQQQQITTPDNAQDVVIK